jgi:hypothetical protein
MNENLPFIWRKYYRKEAASSVKMLEIAHEQARQYLGRAVTAADDVAPGWLRTRSDRR